MAELILGNINQGSRDKPNGLWRPNDVINALHTHTMFFTGICRSHNYLDLSREVLHDLKSNRSFAVKIGEIITLSECARLAEINCVTLEDKKTLAAIIMQLVGRDLEDQEIFGEMNMTLPEGSRLESGMEIAIGYISVLEPLGGGSYRLHHDYPLRKSGPRFEFFEDEDAA